MRHADPSPPSNAVVKKEQSYTSAPSMGRTACIEPQCLYKGALFVHVTVVHHLCTVIAGGDRTCVSDVQSGVTNTVLNLKVLPITPLRCSELL